jgi:hypothetical protein
MQESKSTTPSTRKVRRDYGGGKRGNGHERTKPIRRPDPRKVHVKGGAKSLSSVAGLVMFGAFLRAIGVDRRLRELFHDMKHPDLTIYPMGAQLRLLLDLFVAGEDRVFGLEDLASDPLFVRLAGGVVPSIDTVYRDLDRFDEDRVAALAATMVEHGLVPVRALRTRPEAHMDIDTTVMPMFGEYQGAVPGPNPKYHGRPSYHPIVARCAETGTCVGALLRPGNTSFGNDDAPFVQQCIDNMRGALGPEPVLYVRIDAAGDCARVMGAIHDRGAIFLTKASMTPDLCSAVWAHTGWKTVDRDANGRATRQVAEIKFRRGEWGSSDKLPVRVIAVRTRDRDTGKHLYLWDDLDMTVQVYLTNDLYRDADDVAWKYDGRAGIEPLIAEFKNGWGIGAMSTDTFWGNAATLMLKLLAHNLVRRYVEHCAPAVRGWRTDWIRRVVIRVPGKVVRSGRRTIVHVPRRPALSQLLN